MQISISATSRETIPDRRFNNLPGQRRFLAVTLISGDAYWGFNDDVDDAGASTAGIPMTEGSPVYFASHLYDYSGPLYIYSVGGATINYQELIIP